ncbi:MAG: class I SAM-dependent methyltransferase [Actinomycetota bacterium]
MLDVGAGTGLLALPLLSEGSGSTGSTCPSVLHNLLEKERQGTIGVAIADATRLPFRSAAFDGAYLVVLLVPEWVAVLAEVARRAPGESVPGEHHRLLGLYEEVQRRFLHEAGGLPLAVGLPPNDPAPLVSAMAMLGARGHRLPPVRGRQASRWRSSCITSSAAAHVDLERVAAPAHPCGPPGRAWLHRRFDDLDRPVERVRRRLVVLRPAPARAALLGVGHARERPHRVRPRRGVLRPDPEVLAETEGEMIEVLSAEFGEKGPILEVGVGTGQVALPLAAGGVRVVGIDLARPMMERLVAKAGGRSPFPLVEGDATGMPFADDAFDEAYLRWVLHLIPIGAAR